MDNIVIGPIELVDEPARAGSELVTLVAMLEYYRCVLVRKAVGLTSLQLATPLPPSTLTIGGLVKHMALVEDQWFGHIWTDAPASPPWAGVDWTATPDWDFDSAADDTPAALLALHESAVARARTAIDGVTDLDRVAAAESRLGATNLRWILVHMIEEYARHCGHADLIRESIDGVTGD